MEIHLMFYNVSYANVDEALDAEDGILALVYVCQVCNAWRSVACTDIFYDYFMGGGGVYSKKIIFIEPETYL
jgi:hypothetical protein